MRAWCYGLTVSGALRSRFSSMRITRGALIVAGLELGLSLVFLVLEPQDQQQIAPWLLATPETVFEQAHVWTLATSVFIQLRFLQLILHMLILWWFVPALERFWGTPRFYRFFAITSLAGTLAGCLAGLALGGGYLRTPISRLDPFMDASIVAFGIVYARQPVQFFGVLPLTGRQLMYGILGFVALSVLLQQHWSDAASYAAAMLAAAVMTSKRLSPSLAWKRWRIARARARLTVMSGGKSRTPPRDEHKWLN